MKFKSALITEGSGSIGGLTASHNRGGQYLRARAIPVNPSSAYQQAVRGFLAQLTSIWRDTLTPLQRTAWDNYAEQVAIPDRLGEPRNAGGLAHYIRSNVPRLQCALPRVDDGPTSYNLGAFSNPTFGSFAAATQDFSLGFDDGDAWANEDDAGMIVYGSADQSPSRNYFQGPYRFAAVVLGDSVTPPTTPATIDLPFAVVVGNTTHVYVRVTRADGRLSSPFRGLGVGA